MIPVIFIKFSKTVPASMEHLPTSDALVKREKAFHTPSYERDYEMALGYLARAAEQGRHTIQYIPHEIKGDRERHTRAVYEFLCTRFLTENGFNVALTYGKPPCPRCIDTGLKASCPCQSLSFSDVPLIEIVFFDRHSSAK
jgi:hypothetical protein